jgi:hypothetical protein
LGALDCAVELGRAGRQDKQLQAARLASVFKGGGEFAAAVDLQGVHGEGQAVEERLEELRGDPRGGPAVGLDPVPARDHVARGELLDDHARHRAHLQGVDLDQIAGLLGPRTGQPAIKLAIEGRQSDGWYDLGDISVE